MWAFINLIPSGVWKVILSITVLIGSYAVAYRHGVSTERLSWHTQIAMLETKLKKQEEESNARTKEIIEGYERKVKASRATNGSTRPELTTVRVFNSCPSSEDTPIETRPAVSLPIPVVDQAEWERINHARYEEQRIQLEALIEWVESLYRTWSPQ